LCHWAKYDLDEAKEGESPETKVDERGHCLSVYKEEIGKTKSEPTRNKQHTYTKDWKRANYKRLCSMFDCRRSL
jgi:hypothetical protein